MTDANTILNDFLKQNPDGTIKDWKQAMKELAAGNKDWAEPKKMPVKPVPVKHFIILPSRGIAAWELINQKAS